MATAGKRAAKRKSKSTPKPAKVTAKKTGAARPAKGAAKPTSGLASVSLAGTAAMATAAQKRAEELLALIERRKARIAEDFYEIGRALSELLKKKLYAAIGYASFGEMLQARAVMGRTQAHKLMRIVETMPLKTALALGVEKAFQMARYTAATPELDTPESVLSSGVPVGKKPAAEATVKDLAQAAIVAKKKAAPATKTDTGERSATRAAKLAKGWLAKKGAAVQVQALRRKDGWRVAIEMSAEAVERAFGGQK